MQQKHDKRGSCACCEAHAPKRVEHAVRQPILTRLDSSLTATSDYDSARPAAPDRSLFFSRPPTTARMNCSACLDLFMVAAISSGTPSCICVSSVASMQMSTQASCSEPDRIVYKRVVHPATSIAATLPSNRAVSELLRWTSMPIEQAQLFSRARTRLVLRRGGGAGAGRPRAGVFLSDGTLIGSLASVTLPASGEHVQSLLLLPDDAFSTEATRTHLLSSNVVPVNLSVPIVSRG